MLVLTGLSNLPAKPDGPGDHASGTGSFLTAARCFKTEGANIQNGISFDQIAARAIGGETRFPSLQLGGEGGASMGNCDSGFSCAYVRNITWADDATPLAKEINPESVFDRLFRGVDANANLDERMKRKRHQLSLLDFVKDDTRRLRAKLGTGDRRRLDEYLTGVRELETRLLASDGSSCPQGVRPGNPGDVREKVRLMSDLMVLAFQCDLTRVISFMLGNGGSNRVYNFLGITDGHHQISHHMRAQANYEKLQVIDTWEVEQLSYLLQKMKSIQEPDGTLLDNSAILFSSEIEDGDAHGHTNLPVVLAGKGGGAFQTGRHIRYTGDQPVANLYLAILASIGVNQPTFGRDKEGAPAGTRALNLS